MSSVRGPWRDLFYSQGQDATVRIRRINCMDGVVWQLEICSGGRWANIVLGKDSLNALAGKLAGIEEVAIGPDGR